MQDAKQVTVYQCQKCNLKFTLPLFSGTRSAICPGCNHEFPVRGAATTPHTPQTETTPPNIKTTASRKKTPIDTANYDAELAQIEQFVAFGKLLVCCLLMFIVFVGVGFVGCELFDSPPSTYDSAPSTDDIRITKIIKAKDFVRNYVAKYPDTLDFHDWSYEPKVSGNTVTLKFTCTNAFGVPETHIMDIEI